MNETLNIYEKIGGYEKVNEITNIFYRRILSDANEGNNLVSLDINQQILRMKKLLSYILGADVHESHDAEEFKDRLIRDKIEISKILVFLEEALCEANLKRKEIKDILEIYADFHQREKLYQNSCDRDKKRKI